jgi:hypothetical protein
MNKRRNHTPRTPRSLYGPPRLTRAEKERDHKMNSLIKAKNNGLIDELPAPDALLEEIRESMRGDELDPDWVS